MTGCRRCDDHDVRHPGTLYYAARELHRAWHDMYRPVERAIARALEG